jgi:hypothetical protein
MLTAYLSDDVYVFDADHAMVAFPFKLLREVRAKLATHRISPLQPMEIEFLKQMKDQAGPLISLDALLI